MKTFDDIFENLILEKFNSKFDAYWISPSGKISGVNTTHIQSIIKNPNHFGLTLDYIKKEYENFNEQLGIEGQAREKIMKNLLKSGWIRIRKARNFYTVQIDKLTNKIKDYLQSFTSKMIDSGISKWNEIKLMTSTSMKQKSFDEISKDVLFNESHKIKFIKLII